MKHFTVKHAHHTQKSVRGGQLPGAAFKALLGAASGGAPLSDPMGGPQEGDMMPSQGPQTFSHGGCVNQRSKR